MESQYRLYNEIGMNERLNRIAGQLLTQAQRKLAWRFRVLDTEEINAMALPGGFVYATRGLLERMPDNEAAFVLAHEIQHVERRHSVRMLESELYRQLGLVAAIELISGGRVSEGTANTVALANMVLSNRYTQDMEREADQEGIRMMFRARIDPQGAVDALKTLKRTSQGSMPGFLNAILGTHPLTDDRIRAAQKLVDELDFDIPPTAGASPGLSVAAVPDDRIPPTDSVREAELMLALEGQRFGFRPDPELMRQARYLQANPPAQSQVLADHAAVVWTWPASLSEEQVNTRFLDGELPRILGQRTFKNYGVSVVQTPDGQRRLVLLLT